jgi:hypothetical protein
MFVKCVLRHIDFNGKVVSAPFQNSRRSIDRVITYILNQKEHHSRVKFKQEYISLLQEFEILFDERYLPDWLE